MLVVRRLVAIQVRGEGWGPSAEWLGHPDQAVTLPYFTSFASTELGSDLRGIFVAARLNPSGVDNAPA